MGIILLLLINIFIYAHPLNLRKMDFNLSSGIYHLRFVSYNIENALNINFKNMDEIKSKKNIIYNYTLNKTFENF